MTRRKALFSVDKHFWLLLVELFRCYYVVNGARPIFNNLVLFRLRNLRIWSHILFLVIRLKKNMSAHVWGDIGIMIKQKFHLAQLNLAELIDVSMAFRGVSFLCHILFFDWQVKIFSLQGKSEQSKYIWELICTLCVNGSSIRWDHNGNWQNLNSWHNTINIEVKYWGTHTQRFMVKCQVLQDDLWKFPLCYRTMKRLGTRARHPGRKTEKTKRRKKNQTERWRKRCLKQKVLCI